MSEELVQRFLSAKNNESRRRYFDDLCQWYWWRHFDEYIREHGHEPSFQYSDAFDLEAAVWQYIKEKINL